MPPSGRFSRSRTATAARPLRPSYHPWQAEAIYAAAQVLEDSGRQDAAGKLYQELVDQYPASPRTTLARQSLERILRR